MPAPVNSMRPRPKPSQKQLGGHQPTGVRRASDSDSKPRKLGGGGAAASSSTPAPAGPQSPNTEAALQGNLTRAASRPDAALLESARRARQMGGSGDGSYRGSILSSIYRLPEDGTRAARSLQSFNGPMGRRTVLGQ